MSSSVSLQEIFENFIKFVSISQMNIVLAISEFIISAKQTETIKKLMDFLHIDEFNKINQKVDSAYSEFFKCFRKYGICSAATIGSLQPCTIRVLARIALNSFLQMSPLFCL